MKIQYIKWNVIFISVKCKCHETFCIEGITGSWEEEQNEYGEVKVEAICPFCERVFKQAIDLEGYPAV